MRYTAFSPCNAPQRSCTGSRRQPAAEQQQQQLARCLPTCSSQQQPNPQLQQQQHQHQQHQLSRRAALALPVGLMALAQPRQAQAFSPPPPGYRYHEDKLDGYNFLYPEDWVPVTTSGNDVFYRNPFNIEETLFVDITSPSSSKFESVADLGSPDAAAQAVLARYLDEFMSTRLGVKRVAEVVSAAERTGKDGSRYYDIQIRAKSYASRNQLAVSGSDMSAAVELEWDRRFVTVLGVANRRRYELRLQAASSQFEAKADTLLYVATSFQCREVQA